MKVQRNFFMALLAIGGMISFTACNNDDTDSEEALNDSTIELVEETALTESVEEVIDASVNEAIAYAEDEGQTKSGSTTSESECAVVTTSPDDGSYPRSVTIDFGEECIGFSGLTRSGSITITLSDTLRDPGAKYSVTFDNYSVSGISVNGSKSVENTGTEETPSFTETIDITLVTPSDIEIHKVKTSTREWIEGTDTYSVVDDVYLTTGSAEVTSTAGRSYSYTITSPLKTAPTCENILEGEMEITWSGSDEKIVVDFGDGDCDWKVYISQGRRIIRRAVFLNN